MKVQKTFQNPVQQQGVKKGPPTGGNEDSLQRLRIKLLGIQDSLSVAPWDCCELTDPARCIIQTPQKVRTADDSI